MFYSRHVVACSHVSVFDFFAVTSSKFFVDSKQRRLLWADNQSGCSCAYWLHHFSNRILSSKFNIIIIVIVIISKVLK